MSEAPPARYSHDKTGTGLRMQAFLILRDERGRIPVQRIEDFPDSWLLPGEMVQEGEDPRDAADRIAGMYFESEVEGIEFADLLNFPPDPPHHEKWYMIFVFEAEAPDDLAFPDDTLEHRFTDPDDPPVPLGFDHATVWEEVTGHHPGIDVS
jgi:ADP-ribose pyrophosphatase YjhB (NUDIX family)